MERCVLEHCEFAQGGQCCLVCPKGLSKAIERRNVRRKIEECVAMLKRVHKQTRRDVTGGVHAGKGGYVAYITYHGKQVFLGIRNTNYDARLLREDAEEIIERGDFERWLGELRITNNMHRAAKRKAIKEERERGEGQE